MARPNYGAVNDLSSEVTFGGARPRQLSTNRMEFKQVR